MPEEFSVNDDPDLGAFGDLSAADVRFPRPFGQYMLLQSLAKGGMGEVFLAKHGGIAGIEKFCVVKTLRSAHTDDREYVARFMDEARVVVNLNHRNICQVSDVGRVGSRYFLAMELIAGIDVRSLHERVLQAGHAVPQEVALHIACETLEALDYAHRLKDPVSGEELHLVHRDVSPQNVMINFEGEVKLIDFGLAASTKKTEKTQPNVVMGKMAYMSPEQARGDAVDRRADLFAVAVLLYELLVGERFYAGMRPNDIWSIAGYGGHQPRRMAELHPKLQVVLAAALHKDLGSRYQTCAAFKEALDNVMFEQRIRTSSEQLRRFLQPFIAPLEQEHRHLLAQYQDISLAQLGDDDKSQSFARSPAPGALPPNHTEASWSTPLPSPHDTVVEHSITAPTSPGHTESANGSALSSSVDEATMVVSKMSGAPVPAKSSKMPLIAAAMTLVLIFVLAGVVGLLLRDDQAPQTTPVDKTPIQVTGAGALNVTTAPSKPPTPATPEATHPKDAPEATEPKVTPPPVKTPTSTKPVRKTRRRPKAKTAAKKTTKTAKAKRPPLPAEAFAAKTSTPAQRISFLRKYCKKRTSCASGLVHRAADNLTPERIKPFQKELVRCLNKCMR